jgi:hypothetical protein
VRLGRQEHFLAPRRHDLADVLLAHAAAIPGGGVDVVHAQIDGAVDDRLRIGVSIRLLQRRLPAEAEEAHAMARATQRALGHRRVPAERELLVEEQGSRTGGPHHHEIAPGEIALGHVPPPHRGVRRGLTEARGRDSLDNRPNADRAQPGRPRRVLFSVSSPGEPWHTLGNHPSEAR